MPKNTVWAVVALALAVLASVTVLLLFHVPTTDIFVVDSTVISPILMVLLYSRQNETDTKVDSVVKQTNGFTQAQQDLINRLINHTISTTVPPVPPTGDAGTT
jgi:hypothetical protein